MLSPAGNVAPKAGAANKTAADGVTNAKPDPKTDMQKCILKLTSLPGGHQLAEALKEAMG